MNKRLELHPIQLEIVGIKEIVAKTFIPPRPDIELDIKNGLKQQTGCSNYDKENKTFQVFVNITIGEDKEDGRNPGYLKLTLVGIFRVISEEFTDEQIKDFGENYAFYMLQPYVRDYLFSFSAKCGFKPIMLPIIKIPIFSRKDFVKQEKKSKVKK